MGIGSQIPEALDDDVVELARIGDALQLVGKVVRKRAADAAVGERDEVVGLKRPPSAMRLASTLISPISLTITAARMPPSLARMWLEQCGLAGTEVSGKHDDLHGFVGHMPSFVRHGLQLNLMPNACSYTHAPANNTGYSQAPPYIGAITDGGLFAVAHDGLG